MFRALLFRAVKGGVTHLKPIISAIIKVLMSLFLLTCFFIGHLTLPGYKTLAACDAIEKILYALFPDQNFQFYNNILTYNFIDKALLLCSEKKYDEVIKELEKARYHAELDSVFAKQSNYQYTAPLFNLVGGEKTVSDAIETPLDCFRASLTNNHCFDPIREREEFIMLLK